MKMKEIREKSPEDLDRLEEKIRKELAMLRLQARAGQLAQTSKLGSFRRDIARILTARKDKAGQGKREGKGA